MIRTATLAIAVIEGRGVWLQADGQLVDGHTERVALRLHQLSELSFDVVVLDVSTLTEIDTAGIDIVTTFVQRLHDHGGIVRAIDPTGVLHSLDQHRVPGLFTDGEAPAGAWWQRPPTATDDGP